MDFEISDTPEQTAFRADVRAWLVANTPAGLRPGGGVDHESFEAYQRQRDLGRWLGEKGWLYPTMPVAYGGGGLEIDRAIVVNEELANLRLGLPPYYDSGGTMAAPTILVWGSEEQKSFFLPRICRGEVRTWQLLSEPEAGSDLAGVQMTAIRDGDDYVLNGTKLFIGSDFGADEMWTLAVTDPGGKRHQNLSWFMVDGNSPGVRVVPMDLLGAAIPGGPGSAGDHHKNTIFFDNVRVSAFRLVGGEHNGWRVATTHLEVEHGGAGRPTALPIIAEFFAYCRNTPFDGRPLSDHPDLREPLVEIHRLAEVNRLLGLRNFWLAHADRPRSYEGPQYSYLHRMNNLKIAQLMQQVLGYVALTDDPERGILDGEMELFSRAALIALHPAGTGDIQKLSMARRIGIGREEREAAGRLQ